VTEVTAFSTSWQKKKKEKKYTVKIKSINKVDFSVTSVTETLKALILLNSSGDSHVLKLSRQLSLLSQK